MAQYLLRKGKRFYEIAKFEDSDSPVAVYSFTTRGCSCPAGRRSCKHTQILTAWKRAKEVPGMVFNDLAEHISTIHVS